MSAELSRIVSKALSEGYQLDPDAFDFLRSLPSDIDLQFVVDKVILNKATSSQTRRISKDDLSTALPSHLGLASASTVEPVGDIKSEVDVLSDPTKDIAPADAEAGFKKLFEDRYLRLLAIAKRRPDLKNLTPLQSIGKTSTKQKTKAAGLLSARSSRRGALEMTLDDPSGSVRLLCGDEVAGAASKVPLDSLVIVEASRNREGGLFARSVAQPDIPGRKAVTSAHRAYAILLSDLHIGSRMFLEEDFKRLIRWLNGELGEEDVVRRIKYLIIAGDVIDGVGVYPGQEYQLTEKDLRRQYLVASELIRQIPTNIDIIISPGNHDPVRQALPQPAMSNDLAEPFYRMPNVRLLGNPAYVKLNGVTFLIYHGRSLDDIIATIPDLSYSRPAGAMQVLLKTRHLAPIYGKRTALSPEIRDMLVIDPVPDVFHAGHVHTIDMLEYRGSMLVNSGTWQAQTPFQANMGLEPTPAIAPIVDLSTLNIIKRSFTKDSFS